MARLTCADPDAPHIKALAERIVTERGELLDLYKMLLHSPAVAEGWLKLLTAIRQQTSLPPALRELIIVRIAQLNRATYEAEHHIPIALREGASAEQVDGLQDWEKAPQLFSEEERTALALADSMTRNVQVDQTVWEKARETWSDKTIVELVATIASYNMVSRFLEALEIR